MLKRISKANSAFTADSHINGFLKADPNIIKKSAKNVYLNGFRKPVHVVLASFARPFMTAIVAFSKIGRKLEGVLRKVLV